MLEHIAGQRSSLTGLLLPLGDRTLVLPNVAVAELIGQRALSCQIGEPNWHLGWLDWRQQRLPLIGFEAACGGQTVCGERARIVVLNALGIPACATWHCCCRASRGRASWTASSIMSTCR